VPRTLLARADEATEQPVDFAALRSVGHNKKTEPRPILVSESIVDCANAKHCAAVALSSSLRSAMGTRPNATQLHKGARQHGRPLIG
jgi:hypothetical protein